MYFVWSTGGPKLKYIGCFVDSTPRKLEINIGDSASNTPTECLRRCMAAGYIYAGVQVDICHINK